LIYEAVLLFGVIFCATGIAMIVGAMFRQLNTAYFRQGLAAWLFFVAGYYYIWLWTHGGQTLPMKTWRIRVVAADGSPLEPWRALRRYLLSYLWVAPGCVAASLFPAASLMLVFLLTVANCLLLAIAALFDKDRQFLHDRLAGTRLIVAA
jgi:uncharacterized RDD family membrane protein YckC